MICFPNGKINLGLNILSKRADGFHNIESAIFPVEFFDVLEFLPAKKFNLHVHGIPLPNKNENLISRVWAMMSEKYALQPLAVNLLKSIPSGAGLGGGSSDAAYFLKAVAAYFNLALSTDELKELALKIGSDCPLFIENKPALITGRGENIEPLNISLKGLYLVIIYAGFSMSTQEAYAMITLKKPSKSISEIISQPLVTWRDELVNDFEIPVFEKHPLLSQIKKTLYQSGALYTSMSGSGSAIFGIFYQKPQLDALLKKYNVWEGIINE